MARDLLTDEAWECIADLLPKSAATGRPPRDPRRIVDAIFWVLRTGAPWRDLPAMFGPWQTVWRRFDRWNADGTLAAVLQRLQGKFLAAGAVDPQLWCIDGTVVRAHRCAAGGGKKTTRRSLPTTP